MHAVVYLVVGLWILSVLDASGKYLSMAGVSVFLLTWVRYALHICLVLALRWRHQGLSLLKPKLVKLQTLRAVAMLGSTLLFFSALKYLPLANATAVNFTAPLMVLIASPFLLGEKLKARRIVATLAAMIGVFLVVRPSLEFPAIGLLLSIATAITFAIYQMLTRAVAADNVYTSSTFGAVITFCALTPFMPFVLDWSAPLGVLGKNPDEWRENWLLIVVLLSTGVTGFLGHIFQISAYQRWEASRLGPFVYLQIIASLTLGWWIFSNLPDALSLLGIAIIVAVGVVTAFLEHRDGIREKTQENTSALPSSP